MNNTLYKLSEYIDDAIDNNYNNTNRLIEDISHIFYGRQDMNQQLYEDAVEYMVLKLNCNALIPIEEVSKIANCFRNIEYSNINTLAEAFVNSDGNLPIGIQLDRDGSMLISKQLHMDYSAMYAQSHRLIKQYAKSNNLDGVKYELAKQWYMLHLLENKVIYNKNRLKARFISKAQKDEAIKVRSFILSDYKTYLNWITKHDPNKFNFDTYFKSTPFYKETFKIDKRLLQMMIPI